MKNIKRHGDINFLPSKKLDGEEIKHNGSFVLAEGETTGHCHVITVPKVEDMILTKLPDGSMLVTLKSEAKVTHEEHKTIKVKPGIYHIGREREKDWFSLSVRRVID